MKHLLPLCSILLTLLLTACGDDPIPDPPERGFVCVTALDQDDQPMEGCYFDYEVEDTVFDEEVDYTERYGDPGTFIYDEEACGEEQLLVYGAPGDYSIRAKCGKLEGRLNVDLDEGENEEYSSRLVGSFCTDGSAFETDFHHNTVQLQDHLGFSTDTRCANWLTHPQRLSTEVTGMAMECGGITDCNPQNAEDLLKLEEEEVGWYSKGVAMWLTLKAQTHLVPDGEERTVTITVRQGDDAPQQEIDIPVLIRAPMCGNGVLEYREDCEGNDLHGLTCEYYSFDGGSLSCDNCQVNKEDCFNE